MPKECLDEQIGVWKQFGFMPPDKESTSRVWASSWQYRSQTTAAVVSFDQAGYTGWHELSDCYVANGWTHVSRNTFAPLGEEWPCVISEFTNSREELAFVVFSLFFDDGTPVFPPAYDLSKPAEEQGGFLNKFGNRFSELHPSQQRQDPTRQCQVFIAGQNIPESVRNDALQLHLETRKSFLNCWKENQTNSEQNRVGKEQE